MISGVQVGSIAIISALLASATAADVHRGAANVAPGTHSIPPGADKVSPKANSIPPGSAEVPPGKDGPPPGAADVPRSGFNPSLVTTVVPCRLNAATDADCDTIPDALETALLARFTPYFLFSKDPDHEAYAPADAELYAQRSELQISDDEGNGTVVIQQNVLAQGSSAMLLHDGPLGPSDLMDENVAQLPSDYRLDPLETLTNGQSGNPGRHGNSWSDVLARRNVGLYGHVVPVMLQGAYSYAPRGRTHDPYADCPTGMTKLPPPEPRTFYKIEYWQFFGFNEADAAEIGNHEGDWTSVQLIYDPRDDVIRSVMHYAHGLEFRFDITPEANARQAILSAPDGEIKEYRYCNYFKHFDDVNLSELDWGSVPPKMRIRHGDVAHAQNNVVRFFKAPSETRYEHPVVYIENGAHEFYPTERWSFYGAPKHSGDGFHYLAAPPPNLGEIDHPLAEVPGATVILRFNGLWGTWGRFNTPPPGPPLHLNWTTVAGSPSDELLRKLSLGF